MNRDILEGKWKEMRGQVKQWWGKLTDDDLDRVGGKAEQLIGVLQQKYGYTREQAEQEVNHRLGELKVGQNRITHPCLGGPDVCRRVSRARVVQTGRTRDSQTQKEDKRATLALAPLWSLPGAVILLAIVKLIFRAGRL